MGIHHSITRFLGCKTVDEDRERPFHYRKQNLNPCNGGDTSKSSDKKILKILNFHSLIFKAITGLFQKVRFIFYLSRPSIRADPVPPAPTLSTSDDDPSLVQPLIISDSSSEIGSLADSENYVDAVSWENNSTNREEMDRVVISIPDFAESEHNVDAASCKSNSTNREEMDCAIISIPDFADCENNVDVVSCESNCTSRKEIDCAIISIPDFADGENNVDALSWESNSTNRKEMDCVIISIPEYLRQSLACTSANQEIVDSAVVTDQESLGMGQGRRRRRRRRRANSGEEKVVVAEEEDTVAIRWIKHYSSDHRILLVGEGDFSFSACLAVAFVWASNIIATSLDSKGMDAFHF